MATDLDTLLQQFLRERKYLRNVSPDTIEWYECAWKAFKGSATYCLTDPASLNRSHLDQFIYTLRDRGVKPVTCNTWLKALNAFFRWLHENGHIRERIHMRPLKVEKRLVQTLDLETIRAIVNFKLPTVVTVNKKHLDGPRKGQKAFAWWRVHAMSCALLDTGCRIRELLDARVSDMARGLVEKRATEHLAAIGLGTKTTVKQAFAAKAPSTVTTTLWAEDTPWNEPVELRIVLDEIAALVRSHVVMDADSVNAVALWIAHTHVHDRFEVSPYLAATSPTKRCGKTTLMSIIEQLVYRPLTTCNASPAVIFRAIDKWHPTLIMDEAETYLNGKEELRGILNSGHTRSTAFVLRTVGEDYVPTRFSTWAPKVFALIGKLPTTLEDRSVLIRLRRKLTGDTVLKFSVHSPSTAVTDLRRRLAWWASDSNVGLTGPLPEAPKGLNDRAADNWGPLLAIAGDAGPEWLAKAAAAALSTSLASEDDEDEATMLLHDLRSLFDRLGPVLSTEAIIENLVAMEERPWMDYRFGKALTARQLAQVLDGFEVKPKKIRTSPTTTVRGYRGVHRPPLGWRSVTATSATLLR